MGTSDRGFYQIFRWWGIGTHLSQPRLKPRPIMYGTTKQCLQAFGLNDLAGLPALRNIKDLAEAEPLLLPNVDVEASAESSGEAHHEAPAMTDAVMADVSRHTSLEIDLGA